MKRLLVFFTITLCFTATFAQSESYLPDYLPKLASACDLPDLTVEQKYLCQDCRFRAERDFEVQCHDEIEKAYDYATALMDLVVFPKVAQEIGYRDWENAEIEKQNCKVRWIHQCFLSGQ